MNNLIDITNNLLNLCDNIVNLNNNFFNNVTFNDFFLDFFN